MADCKHEFIYDEQTGKAACKKCGYVVAKEDKKEALVYAMNRLKMEEADNG